MLPEEAYFSVQETLTRPLAALAFGRKNVSIPFTKSLLDETQCSVTDNFMPFCGHFFGEFEDAFVVIWPVYKVLEVPAARCGRQLVVYLERNRDEQGQHAVVIGSNAFCIRVGDR